MIPTDADTAAAREFLREIHGNIGLPMYHRAAMEKPLASLIAQARRDGAAGARTPGTHEICAYGPERCSNMYDFQWCECENENCPLRTATEGRE